MLIKTFGSAVFGINAATITIETDVTKEIKFLLVGLPDNAVKESKQRIESALQIIGYKWPKHKIIVKGPGKRETCSGNCCSRFTKTLYLLVFFQL
jgi:hypothetical protein